MGMVSSSAFGTTLPPNTPHPPKTPTRQQKRTELKKKYNEKMGTPSPSNSAGSLTSTPSSGLTINTAITTPRLLQGPIPKGITLTPRTQAWYDQIHGNSSGFGNNTANQAPMQMAYNVPNGMVAAQANGLAINYGNGVEVPRVNNMVDSFNGTANNNVAEGPGKDFFNFLEKMKANPADHVTIVDQQENADEGSAINYDAGMAAPQADMTTTAFDGRMDNNTGAASYMNNNGPYFINNDNNNNGMHTTNYGNGAGINGAGTMTDPAAVSQKNNMEGCSSSNTFAPGIGSNMFETTQSILDYLPDALDYSAWHEFMNLQPSDLTWESPHGNNSGSSDSTTVNDDIAPTSSETISPSAIANLSLAPANTDDPATAAAASPDASFTSGATATGSAIPTTTLTEDFTQTQDPLIRKPLFGHFQTSRTTGSTLEAVRTTGTGANGMIECLDNVVQNARSAGVSDGGILFVMQEYVRMFKYGQCF